MRIYWYWPFARDEEMPLVAEVARPGDTLLVDVLDRPNSPSGSTGERYAVRNAVREVTSQRHGSLAWAGSRVITYFVRVRDRRRAVREFAPDVCHVMFQNRLVDWAALPMLSRRTALVCTVHDVVPHESRLPKSLERRVLRHLYRRCGHVVVHHESVGRRLVQEFDVPCARITVIEPQVPTLARGTVDRSASGSYRLLFFGTLRSNKGLAELLDAVASLPDDDLSLVVAGRGNDALEKLVARRAAADPRIVVLAGWITPTRKAQLYADCDVVVLPYTSFSSQSAVLYDAYAAGRPVIVTDVGALGETVFRDGSGWVVPPSDVPSLARVVGSSGRDRQELILRGEAAARFARTRTPVLVAAQLRALYDDILAGRKPC